MQLTEIECPVRLRLRGPAFWLTTALGAVNVLLTAIVLIMCTCCVGNMPVRAPLPDEQMLRSVELRTTCIGRSILGLFDADAPSVAISLAAKSGSGVIVGHHKILTASHVPNCDHEQLATVVAKLNGEWVSVYEAHDYKPGRDIALLYVPQDTGWDTLSYRTEVLRNENVCAAFAFPVAHFDCGTFIEYQGEPHNGVIAIPVVSGNSGSGLFDRQGNLVGIVTAQQLCHLQISMPGAEFEMVGGSDCHGFASMLGTVVAP